MNENEGGRVSVPRLILIPVIVSAAVTLFRLFGELQHWSPRWFNPESGGVVPHGLTWVVGIVWLPVPFGVYFALRLARGGRGPESAGRAVLMALAGVALLAAFFFGVLPRLRGLGMQAVLLLIWSAAVLAAALQFLGWRSLAKTLALYGLASRAFVVLVMLLAMLGNWGTHYDYGTDPDVVRMPFATKFWWLAFFPQLVFWVGFTVVLGALSGSIACALTRRGRAPQPAPAAT